MMIHGVKADTLSSTSPHDHLRKVIGSLRHMRQVEAAKHLHMSVSKMQRLCRTIGIQRWQRAACARPRCHGTATTGAGKSAAAEEATKSASDEDPDAGSDSETNCAEHTVFFPTLPTLPTLHMPCHPPSLPAMWLPVPASHSIPLLSCSAPCVVFGQAQPHKLQSADMGKLGLFTLELQIDKLKASIAGFKPWDATNCRPLIANEAPLLTFQLTNHQANFETLAVQTWNYTPLPLPQLPFKKTQQPFNNVFSPPQEMAEYVPQQTLQMLDGKIVDAERVSQSESFFLACCKIFNAP